ncbi:FAD dependent oxidoreductase [Oceanotoga teriensis]|uniref:FAD dependent oxidoreductase n=1 Tax=Oceanotoga teriensis TaxID=515440 RepID=A0AA45HIN8_9BACT|nr:FAD-dependent oxidoreductase [Oceanotoga teriensis]PWJ95106.1 FAD dependent oxidoreductase [Oceanotoga teriensis]
MKKYDVIIIGGGISGISAAISCSKLGLKTLIIEKNNNPGGVLTNCNVMPMMTFHSKKRQTIQGIGQEIIEELKKVKGTYGHLKDPIGFVESITPFKPEKMKLVLSNLIKKYKIDTVFGVIINEIKIEQNKINYISIINEYMEEHIKSLFYIDATGDGNFSVKAGAKKITQNSTPQPSTMVYKIKGINKEKIKDYVLKNKKNFTLNENTTALKEYLAISGYFNEIKKFKDYNINFKRDRLLFFEIPFSTDEILMNTSRYNFDGTNPYEKTKNQLNSFKDTENFESFLKNEIYGFENINSIETSSIIGIRETFHVKGKKIIEYKDLLKKDININSIAVGAYPIDIHDSGSDKIITKKTSEEYYIPFEALIPETVENISLAGRAISATSEAFSAIRTSPLACATGEAAGIIAYTYIKNSKIEESSYKDIKNILDKRGIIYK